MTARRVPTPCIRMDAAGAVFLRTYARVHAAALGRHLWPCERERGARIWRRAQVWARMIRGGR